MKTEHRSEAGVVEGNHGNHKLINTADARKINNKWYTKHLKYKHMKKKII
jgi:hypothetical protein